MIYDFLTLASSAFVALEALHKSRTVGFQRGAHCAPLLPAKYTHVHDQASTQYFSLKKTLGCAFFLLVFKST